MERTCKNCGKSVKEIYVLCWSCNEKSKKASYGIISIYLDSNKPINCSYKLCLDCHKESECNACNYTGCSYWSKNIYVNCMNCDPFVKTNILTDSNYNFSLI